MYILKNHAQEKNAQSAKKQKIKTHNKHFGIVAYERRTGVEKGDM